MTRPTLTQIMAALDELGAAVRSGDLTRYRAALAAARENELTAEQILDAYGWSTRDGNVAPFDVDGNPKTNHP